MFDLAMKGIVAWPGTLTQQQGGSFVDVPITVSFRVFTRAELRERDKNALATALGKLYELVRKQASTESIQAVRDEMEVIDRSEEAELRARVTGWSGFGNADSGAELPYTTDLFTAVIAFDPYYQALWKMLLDASRNARPKNSLPGPDSSPGPGQTLTA
jgi:hypothetical protein